MKDLSRRQFMQISMAGGASLWAVSHGASNAAEGLTPIAQAESSAKVAGYSLSKVQRWLNEKALPLIDADTGLYLADGRWNYRDTAADCYPFLCWAAHVTDREALYGPVLDILSAEQRLCNHFGRVPVPFDLQKKAKMTSLSQDEIVFQASEYVKDGLIAIVEATGKGPWFQRMLGIQEDLWEQASVETPYGKIPSTNVEVNGEQLQALARLFTMTGDEKFLMWAERLADYYLSNEDYVPVRLRDHGCEIIGGLGLLAGVESEINPRKAEQYLDRLKVMFDAILAKATNEDGLMFNTLGNPRSKLSDGWGYNYVGFLCYDMAVDRPQYRDQIVSTLRNLAKPAYRNLSWEGNHSIDGYADSIEGAIYLLNRLPVQEGLDWVDGEMARNVVRSNDPLATAKLWGTMKLESNGVRTTIMHALMHTQGLIARPWRQDLNLGAARHDDGSLSIVMTAAKPWDGHLEFDGPRHRLFMGFEHDWPRMNTLPEWFVVEPARSYEVSGADGRRQTHKGHGLHRGLKLSVSPERPQRLTVTMPSD